MGYLDNADVVLDQVTVVRLVNDDDVNGVVITAQVEVGCTHHHLGVVFGASDRLKIDYLRTQTIKNLILK